MSSKEYYDNTENKEPTKLIRYFINKISKNTGKAIELGCGAGVDTAFLIKNGWNVLAIDAFDTKDRIVKKLNKEELERFRFSQQKFEDIKLEQNNLVVAFYSIPFCNKVNFEEFWNKIKNSILPGGYFVGNFFGVNDEWNKAEKENKINFLTGNEVKDLFNGFEIVTFKEIEKDGVTGLGNLKHWHLINVIAKKK